MKVCKKCNTEKDESEFSWHKETRKGKEYGYLNGTCKICLAAIQRERTKKQRATPEGREKHNKWAREGHKRDREKNLARMREKRKTPEWKAYMKAYRERNKEKIRQQEILTKKKYHEKNKNPVTDKYVSSLLRNQGKEINETNIDLEKIKVLVHRIKKVVSQVEAVEGTKVCTVCGIEKGLSDFHANNTMPNKRIARCRECIKIIKATERQKRKNENNSKS